MIKEAIKAVKHLPDTIKQLGRRKYIMPFFTVMVCTIIIVAVFCAIAYSIVDTHKESLGKYYFEKMNRDHFVARFDDTKFNVEISALVKNSKAQSASVWMIDVGSNKKRLLYRYLAKTGKEDKEFYREDFPLFYYTENKNAFGDVIIGKVPCLEMVPETNYGDALAKEGINFVCFVKVPPESGQFIGMIELEFTSKPDELVKADEQENPAKRVTFNNRLKKASENIIKKGDK